MRVAPTTSERLLFEALRAAFPEIAFRRQASGIGSKAAKRDHFKTGQRAFVSETGSFLSFGDGD
jgi:hypothetical protein